MLYLGKTQELKIVREKDFGVYLTDEEETGTVLLPIKQVPEGKHIGDSVKVFLYNDSEDRMIATTKKPVMEVGEIAKLRVKDVTAIGAFADIGLEKDVLIPHREIRYEIEKGEIVEAYLYVDKSGRLAATMYTSNKKDAKKIDDSEVSSYHYNKNADRVLKIILNDFDGQLPYTDKTVSPEDVKKDFGMSKAAFKRAIGKLLKEEKIKITKTAIFYVY